MAREAYFIAVLQTYGLPVPEMEYRFHPVRKYRFDFAFPAKKLAIEINGGLWVKGGAHSLPTNIKRDMEKHNLATLMGWRVLSFEPSQMLKTETLNLIRDCYNQ